MLKIKTARRAVALSLVLTVIIAILAGCGNKVEATEKGISIARSAIKVADDYLDNNISGDKADEKLEELQKKMEYVDSMPRDTDEQNDQYQADFLIQCDLVLLSHNIMFDKYGDNKYDDIIEVRNSLAERIGEKKR